MPAAIVHFALAKEAFKAAVSDGILDRSHPTIEQAFLFGSIAPDAGYFPGGHTISADLAHYVRSADLGRSLVGRAESTTDRAFALGWLSHVVADGRIHPLINHGVAELLTGERNPPIPYANDVANHIRVELGLDVWLHSRYRRLAGRSSGVAVFASETIRSRIAAYRETYCVEFEHAEFARSDRAIARWLPAFLRFEAIQGRLLHHAGGSLVSNSIAWSTISGARKVAGIIGRDSMAYAFLTIARPPDWLVKAVEEEIVRFGDEFVALCRNDFSGLDNLNLDTGKPDNHQPAYPPEVAAREYLRCRSLETVEPRPKAHTRVALQDSSSERTS